MKRASFLAVAFCLAALVAQSPTSRASQDDKRQTVQQAGSPAEKYFTDVVLINQNGEQMRLYSDLIKGKIVVIIPFFTSCTGVCPVMNRNLESIQEKIGERLGKDIYLISISVDPLTDTPPRLKEYARRFNARPGWYF